jgi:hypothetical protein
MDVLVEFCHTGRLGPIATGLNAVDVERLIDVPVSTRDMHGESNRQHFNYRDLLLVLTGNYSETRDRSRLTVESIRVDFYDRPVRLPKPIADALTHDWSSPGLQDVLDTLQASGLNATSRSQTQTPRGQLVRTYNVDDNKMILAAIDDRLWYLQRPER